MFKKLKKEIKTNNILSAPTYFEMKQNNRAVCFVDESKTQWYPLLAASIPTIINKLFDVNYIKDGINLMKLLESDEYTKYLINYYSNGIEKFGKNWCYADIVTTLFCLSEIISPEKYLEIGVRRGRSVCAVASKTKDCNLYMFDQWKANYAGMNNPGQELVEQELDKIGHIGKRIFISGNSHETIKQFLKENPDIAFDLITVDGDHSYNGAAEDLCDVLPTLKIGGAVVFDDISHPKHEYLSDVWKTLVENDNRFSSWRFTDIGYGVGFALRKW